MRGETDLGRLLAGLGPRLRAGDWVVATLPAGRLGEAAALEPFATVREDEGLTVVVEHGRAVAAGLPFAGVFALLTLRVHSSLAAVGLTAAVAQRLADHGISANVLAAYHHDHLLVPRPQAEEALRLLEGLAEEARRGPASAGPSPTP